jgi:hypothetical protein
MIAFFAPLLALLLTLAPGTAGAERNYHCDGDLLVARTDNGPVDALGIPNVVAGTPPGAFVVLSWRDLSLQLPRTNNAGAPSYTDGTWWWSLEDPDHPRFRRLQGLGRIEAFSCRQEPAPQETAQQPG